MDVNKILVFLILNKLLKGSSTANMPETSIDSNVVKSPMKKAKKNNKKDKKDVPAAVSELPIKVQPSVVSSAPSTPSTPSSDAPVHKTKAKKDKNNKTKQMTKQSTTESLQSIENIKEIEEAKECPFQAAFETFTGNKPKKQRKPKKVTKEDSFVSDDQSIQAERKVIDVEIKPKDNKEKRLKAEKKKLAANCNDIDDKSQVWAELILWILLYLRVFIFIFLNFDLDLHWWWWWWMDNIYGVVGILLEMFITISAVDQKP